MRQQEDQQRQKRRIEPEQEPEPEPADDPQQLEWAEEEVRQADYRPIPRGADLQTGVKEVLEALKIPENVAASEIDAEDRALNLVEEQRMAAEQRLLEKEGEHEFERIDDSPIEEMKREIPQASSRPLPAHYLLDLRRAVIEREILGPCKARRYGR